MTIFLDANIVRVFRNVIQSKQMSEILMRMGHFFKKVQAKFLNLSPWIWSCSLRNVSCWPENWDFLSHAETVFGVISRMCPYTFYQFLHVLGLEMTFWVAWR